MSIETAAILDEAANVIRRNGHHKGAYYAELPGKPPADCPVCIYGAIHVAAIGRPFTERNDSDEALTPAFKARSSMRQHVGTVALAAWNDQPDRTAEQVIAALEGASRAEREAAS